MRRASAQHPVRIGLVGDLHYADTPDRDGNSFRMSAVKLAQALDATPDYLINGSLDDKAENTISDNELLMQFKKVEKLPGDKKKLVKEFLDAFLFKDNVQKQLVL